MGGTCGPNSTDCAGITTLRDVFRGGAFVPVVPPRRRVGWRWVHRARRRGAAMGLRRSRIARSATSALLLAAAVALPAGPAVANSGGLAPGFARDGEATADGGGGFEQAFAVAAQADGRIVAVGPSGVFDGEEGGGQIRTSFTVVRYLPDGTLDPSFGSGGVAQPDLRAGVDAMRVLIQPDGRILVAGWGFDVDHSVVSVARYLPDGSLDPAFDEVVWYPGLVAVGALGLALAPDGRIYIGTGLELGFTDNERLSDTVIGAFLPDGTPDPAFGYGGTVRLDLGVADDAVDLEVLPDGRL